MKTSDLYSLLQKIRLLSLTLSYSAIIEYYHNDTLVQDIIRELQAN